MPASDRERDGDERRPSLPERRRPSRCREAAHQELALRADVEQAGLEAEADRQAREDQRRGGAPACRDRPLHRERATPRQRPVGRDRQEEVEAAR